MLAVLGLVPAQGALGVVHDLVRDLLVAGRGQAVHELGVGAGEVHHVHGDLVLGIEDIHVVGAGDLVVVQAVPHVGVDEVGALDGLDVVGDHDGAAGLLAVLLADGHELLAELGALLLGADVQAAVGDLVTLGAELHEVHADLGGDEHQGHADLGGVADEGQGAVLDLLALGEVLQHGHEVTHLLGGVVELGHAVEDGGGGAGGQALDVGVTVDAGHHDVEQGAHNAGGVAQGLMAAQLDGARAVELRMATEVKHGGLEGDAGAGGDLLEDHAQGLVAKEVRIVAVDLDGLLHSDGEILDGENLLLGEVVGVDEVLRVRHDVLLSPVSGFLRSAAAPLLSAPFVLMTTSHLGSGTGKKQAGLFCKMMGERRHQPS